MARNGLTPLQAAAMDGNSHEVERLIREGADIEDVGTDGAPPLYLACHSGSIHAPSNDEDLSRNLMGTLTLSRKKRDQLTARSALLLIEAGADIERPHDVNPDSRDWRPLHGALLGYNGYLAEFLLDKGVDGAAIAIAPADREVTPLCLAKIYTPGYEDLIARLEKALK